MGVIHYEPPIRLSPEEQLAQELFKELVLNPEYDKLPIEEITGRAFAWANAFFTKLTDVREALKEPDMYTRKPQQPETKP